MKDQLGMKIVCIMCKEVKELRGLNAKIHKFIVYIFKTQAFPNCSGLYRPFRLMGLIGPNRVLPALAFGLKSFRKPDNEYQHIQNTYKTMLSVKSMKLRIHTYDIHNTCTTTHLKGQ